VRNSAAPIWRAVLRFRRSLADQYLVMERGEIVARGRGEDMEADGVRSLLAV
jgi:urea transport system ATP-binding protein